MATRKYFLFVILFAGSLLPAQSYGQGWALDTTSSASDWGTFALGFATGYGAHELGHYVVASHEGFQVGVDGVTIVYPNAVYTPSSRLRVASAGFQAQWLAAELAFRDHRGNASKEAPGNFGAGVICAHLGITLAYLTVLKNHPQGDANGMSEATKKSTDQIALTLAIPAALDAWRLFGNHVPEWVPQLSVMSKGLGVAWAWSY